MKPSQQVNPEKIAWHKVLLFAICYSEPKRMAVLKAVDIPGLNTEVHLLLQQPLLY